ncbi:MAG: sensor histidine kinase [Vitreoscilla sp.]
MADEPTIAQDKRPWRFLQDLRALVATEWSSLVFVACIVALLMLVRQAVQFAVNPDVPDFILSDSLREALADFRDHAEVALLMFCIIQPVRRRAPDDARRVVLLVCAVALAGALASVLRTLQLRYGGVEMEWGDPQVAAYYVRFTLPAAFIVTVAEFHRREIRSIEAMHSAQAERAALEQETLQARLKTLEAQIEPHFLFNTLANVRRLYETDPAAGETMLERLMRYLLVALPSMRDELPTLGREAQLIEAYLELQQVRMGRRLAYRVEIAPALREIAVPSMMLLTLVENAIKHGLAPLREGGRVDVGACIDGDDLQLRVADTGRGFGADSSGMGTGLANIQARLCAMFGEAAALTLTPGEACGLQATIRLPLRAGS